MRQKQHSIFTSCSMVMARIMFSESWMQATTQRLHRKTMTIQITNLCLFVTHAQPVLCHVRLGRPWCEFAQRVASREVSIQMVSGVNMIRQSLCAFGTFDSDWCFSEALAHR